ncbi:MAG TPA: DNA-directed RNA polymerase subunit K [Candidatus Saccharimonadales bacterium]|nr:DNA-directed RNA polymerase subunit K [Candidatus Saccharimonadales bacterium]
MEYTRFEKARIIGARALQLAYGAPPLIKVPEGINEPLQLAEMEFREEVIPIVVVKDRERE